ncbi:MAG: SDR family oxidoreductase [Methanocella sp.]
MKADLLVRLGLRSDDLAEKTAVVTGAGQGIGRELAIALSRLGAAVVIAEIKDTGAEVESLIRAEGGRALFVKSDISDESSVNALAEQARGTFGKVDILVNNAVTISIGSVLELPPAAWDRAFSVNLKGPVLLIKAFLPQMLGRKDGSIVNVLSSEGLAYLAPYAASKGALQSLTSSLVAELGESTGVSVFNFAPGMIDTPTFNAAAEQVAPRMGLTPEQFKHLGVNPGYEGLMPAEDCAAGLAYAIVHAKENHGQTADAFKPLIASGAIRMSASAEIANGKKPSAVQTGTPTQAGVASASKELQKVIEAVSRETEELDLFKKTWVKNDFNRKAGMSIKDWVAMSGDLTRDMEELERSGRSDAIKGKLPYVISRLEKLETYFRAQAENAKGYFKDPEQRDVALAELARRESVTAVTVKALKELSK